MRLDFAKLAVRCFKDVGSNIHRIVSIANQLAFVTARVAKVEDEAPSGGGSVHEEREKIVELDRIVKDDDKD